jgi:hypothetical protein
VEGTPDPPSIAIFLPTASRPPRSHCCSPTSSCSTFEKTNLNPQGHTAVAGILAEHPGRWIDSRELTTGSSRSGHVGALPSELP